MIIGQGYSRPDGGVGEDHFRRFPLQRPITGQTFTRALAGNGIAISMDGKGAWRDKEFVERLWRRVKYEEVSARLRQRQRSPCFNRPVF